MRVSVGACEAPFPSRASSVVSQCAHSRRPGETARPALHTLTGLAPAGHGDYIDWGTSRAAHGQVAGTSNDTELEKLSSVRRTELAVRRMDK